YDAISITNASARDLKIGKIDALAGNATISLQGEDDTWIPNVTTVWNPTTIDIRNTNAAATDADIILTGDVLNEQGSTTIVNAAGAGSDIVRSSTAVDVNSQRITLEAQHG